VPGTACCSKAQNTVASSVHVGADILNFILYFQLINSDQKTVSDGMEPARYLEQPLKR
jgi:hypothetical protein